MALIPKNSIRTERIVQSAAHLFAQQGYHGTSTREIARLADVSENTLFRHFDHKEDIFWAALRMHAAGLRLRREIVEQMESCDPPEIVFPKIFEMLEISVKSRPEFLRLLAIAFLELRGKAFQFSKEYLFPVIFAINRYLAASVENGQIRNLDPAMATTALLTMTLLHEGFVKIVDGDSAAFGDSRDAARAYTKFWLDLVTPAHQDLASREQPATRYRTL